MARANERELRHGGGYVVATIAPAIFSRVVITFHLPTAGTIDVPGSVVNLTGRGFFVQFDKGIEYEALQTAVEFLAEIGGIPEMDSEPEVGDELEPATEAESARGLQPAPASQPEGQAEATPAPVVAAEPPEPEPPAPARPVVPTLPVQPSPLPVQSTPSRALRSAWDLVDLGSSEPLAAQVARLDVAEKLLLARHATRAVRQVLIRDPDQRIQAEVIRNPKLGQVEVLEYTTLPNVHPDVLAWVADQRRFVRLQPVISNLLLHTSTPEPVRVRLAASLGPSGMLRVSRDESCPAGLRKLLQQRLAEVGIA